MTDDRRRDSNGNPFATSKGKLPSIPDRQGGTLDSFWNAVKETIEVLTGGRGSRFDAAVTWRDLANLGIDVTKYIGAGRPQAFRPPGDGVQVQIGNGLYATMSFAEFEAAIKATQLYKDLNRGLNDATRFDALPASIRDILLKDIAAEARERGADIRRVDSKLQTIEQSVATVVQEVTAAAGNATSGVRDTVFAYAEQGRAVAGKVTQIKARLDDVDGAGVTIEELMYGTAGYDGVMGQYTVKIDANGALAGFGLTATNYNGVPDSAFIIRADRFAIVSPTYTGGMTTSPASNLVPFGVDASGVYINGTVRINSTSTTLDSLANDTGVNIASSSEFFKVDTAGAAVNSTITLTATLVGGLTGTVTWTASAGWTGTPPTGTNVWTVNAADQTADAVTYTATKVDGADTYVDSFTIVRLRDGSDALTAILTNESHGIPTAADGTSPVLAGAGGTMKVYRGTTLLTSGVTFAIASGGNPDGLSVSINSTSGVYSVSGVGTWPAGTAAATVTFNATVTASSTVLTKVFSLTKAKQGFTGAGTALVVAQPSSLVFRVAKDGTVSPSSISIPVVRQNTADSVTWATSPSLASLDGSSGTSKTLYPRSVDPSPNMGSNNSVLITVTCGSLTDQFTVVKVYEGSDAVTAFLSNEAHTVPSASDGSSPDFTGASTTMYVFVGATDTSTLWTYTTSASSGVTISPTNNRTFSVTGMTVNSGYVDVTASRATFSNVVKRFTITKSRQGSQGNIGNTGTRGSRTLYLTNVSYTSGFGAAAYKSAATSAIATATSGSTPTTPIDGDTVYFTNGTNYATTYTYRLTPSPDWYLPGVVIDGSLLVTGTVSAAKLTSGTATIAGAAGTVNLGSSGNNFAAQVPLAVERSSNSYSAFVVSDAASVSTNSSIPLVYLWARQSVLKLNAYGTTGTGFTLDVTGKNDTGIGVSAAYDTAAISGFNNNTSTALRIATSVSGGTGGVAYAAYAYSGAGKIYAVAGLGPFTGFHDTLTHIDDLPDVGDIMVDVQCIRRYDISNTLFRTAKSSAPNQKGAIGIASQIVYAGPATERGTDSPEPEIISYELRTVHVNALGEGQVSVCGEGGNIEIGDLIVTSSIPGKGMRQADDLVRSCTVARAREAVSFSGPGDVKLVACVYLCG